MSSLFRKKKDKSKNREADSSSDISKIDASSVSLSVTEMTYVSTPSASQVAQIRKDKNKEKAEERRNDIIETSLSGTAVVLGLVNEAAQFSNVPGLQNAASLALGIVTIVQAVKESNRQYGLLARDATDFIAAIWRSYLQSTHKEDWLSPDLRDVITELVVTLSDITEFVNDKAKRNKFTKILSSKADPSQVLEYRERIKSAVKKFELTSHLKLHEMIQQVHRDQLAIAQHLSQQGIESLPEGAMVLHALGKTPSGFDMGTDANTSLVTLPSSAGSTQPSSTATSPRAVDQPAFLIERSTQSPRIVLTRADTLPPADSTSNSPQPSSPPVAPARPSQPQPPPSSPPLSSPSSLPSSPSFTDSSISSPLSAGSGTVVSPTLVGSPDSDRLLSASAAAMHGPSANSKSNNIDDQHTYDHEEHDHDIDISVDATHAPASDPGPDSVRMGRRMRTSSGNSILKGVVTASPSGTASETESLNGRSPAMSETSTAVSEGGVISAATRALEKERQYFDERDRMDDDEDEDGEGQYEEQPSQRKQYEERPSQSKRAGRGSARTDTESTLTSERKDTLKSPVPRREQKQTTIYEDEERRCESPLQDQPRRRQRQETQDHPPAKKRPQSKSTQDTYDDDPPSRPARGPVGKTGPKRSDTARTERPRRETYDEFEEEEPRGTKGKGKAAQRDYRATVQDESDEEDDQEEYSQSESDDDDDGDVGKFVAGARRQAAAAVSNRLASASAVGKSTRKAAENNNAVGKNERLSFKLSKLNIKSQRKQQQQEEEEDSEEEEEEEPAPPPPKKRRPKQPPQQDPYNQYGHHPSYAPDPYYGAYGGQYHGYHHPPPPPQPQHPNYYGHPPPPPPRYGPGALGGFIPGLGYGMGSGTSSTVTMTNVGNDNSVHIITNKTKKSKRTQG